MAAHVTLDQVSTMFQAMGDKNDLRFLKNADAGDLAIKDKVSSTDLDSSLATAFNNKANSSDVYTKAQIDAKLTSAYKVGGSKTALQLTNVLLDSAHEGFVYNISTDLTTTSDFVEGSGNTYPAGTNVVVIEATPASGNTPATYKFDCLPGFIDLSNIGSGTEGKIYTEGNGIDIDENDDIITIQLNSSKLNGLDLSSNGLGMNTVVADTHGYVAATGTYVSGTTYYTDSTGSTIADTSDYVNGTTSVSGLYVDAITTNGTAGAMTSADKYKLDNIGIATFSDITPIVNKLYAS